MQYRISPPPMNPIARLLAGVVAVLAVAGALFFGIIVLAVVLGLGLIMWLLLWLRMWWLGRRGGPGPARPDAGARRGDDDGEVIDAEYTVVSRKDDD